MSEVDYDRIEKIAHTAANTSFSKMEQAIERCIDNKFKSMGMEDVKKMQRLIIYGEDCMKNRRDLRRSFIGGVGGHLATAVVTLFSVWLASVKGIFN